jgi:hypothetical protein
MADLTMRKLGPGSFVVDVAHEGTATTHQVEVPEGLAENLGGAGTSDERLVEESFDYLLERESNTSILRKFSIDRIGDYFPGWGSEMERRLKP